MAQTNPFQIQNEISVKEVAQKVVPKLPANQSSYEHIARLKRKSRVYQQPNLNFIKPIPSNNIKPNLNFSSRLKSTESYSDSSSPELAEYEYPKVRYGNDMKYSGGRSKFKGIKALAMSSNSTTYNDEEDENESTNQNVINSKSDDIFSNINHIMNGVVNGANGIKEVNTTSSTHKRLETTYETMAGIELEFAPRTEPFWEMLPTPDGVLCGGESIMYYRNRRGQESLYLATDGEEDEVGVFQYDIANGEWHLFAEYPSDFRPELHGNCIHWKSQKLYIFDRRQFAILDMKRKKWTISGGDRARFMSYESFNEMEYNPHGHGPMTNMHPMDQMQGLGVRPQLKNSQSVEASALELLGIQSVYVPLPMDLNGEIHLFGRTDYPPGTYHLLLDDTQKWIKLKGFPVDEHMRGQRMVYSKGMSKLVVCGGQKQDEFTGSWENSNAIWICDVKRRHQVMGYKWREIKCRLPFGGKVFSVVVAFGSILVVIYLRENEQKKIYCLDLMDREENYQFIESNQKFPFKGDCTFTDAVVTGDEDEMVHLMDFGTFGHCRVSMIHLIGSVLRKRYKIRHRLCVSGYLRTKMDVESLFQYSPDGLIRGISKYVSVLG